MKSAPNIYLAIVLRLFLVLIFLQVLDWMVFSRVPLGVVEGCRTVQALFGLIVTAVFVGPSVRKLFLGGAQETKSQRLLVAAPQGQGPGDSSRGIVRRSRDVVIAQSVVLSVIWIGIVALLPAVGSDKGTVISLMRHGVIFSAFFSSIFLLVLPRDPDSNERQPRSRLLWRPSFNVLFVSACGCWLAPALVMLVGAQIFDRSEYLKVVFPVWYAFLPLAAFVVKGYRRQ